MPWAAVPRAVFFDLDDTLLQQWPHVHACWRDALHEVRARLARDEETVFAAIRARMDWYWSDPQRHRAGRLRMRDTRRAQVREAFRASAIADDAMADAVADRYAVLRDERTTLFPGARDVLETLREREMALGMITNGESRMQREKIDRFELAPYFRVIVIEEEFGCGKPDDRVYRHALAGAGVDAADAWMVGDNLEWDVAGPQRAGMAGIWHDTRGGGLPRGVAVQPDRIVTAIPDLLGLLDAPRA